MWKELANSPPEVGQAYEEGHLTEGEMRTLRRRLAHSALSDVCWAASQDLVKLTARLKRGRQEEDEGDALLDESESANRQPSRGTGLDVIRPPEYWPCLKQQEGDTKKTSMLAVGKTKQTTKYRAGHTIPMECWPEGRAFEWMNTGTPGAVQDQGIGNR